MKRGEVHGPMDAQIGKSGFKYIWKVPKRKFSNVLFRVMIPVHGERKPNSRGGLQKNIGYFATIDEAVDARNRYLKHGK